MMRIASLASHIPPGTASALEVIRAAGAPDIEARVFTRVFGIEQVAVGTPGQDVADHLAAVLNRLQRSHAGPRPDTLIYTHGIPVQYTGTSSPAGRLQQEHPFLAQVRNVFEIDQFNCAGLFWALDFAKALLASKAARSIVILAGDDQSALPLEERYIPGCTLLGDAFAGVVVDVQDGGPRVTDLTLETAPEFAFGQYGSEAEMKHFNSAHTASVDSLLTALEVAADGTEPILPHNVNRLVWTQYCRARGFDIGKVRLDLLGLSGHCYTTDPLLLLDRLLDAADGPALPDSVTLLSVALGGFSGACRIALADGPPAGRSHAHR